MFNYLVGTLAPILAEVRNDLISASQITRMENESLYIGGTDVPFKWDDFFYNLSLEGLHNTEAFKNKIASDINKYDTFKEYINYYAKNFDKNCN
ncbi:hypothetical protein ACXIHB_04985 [Tenacibaculum sp. IMCC1]|uniref:Uncharacterized protein n=1 Tax=Tenacibaculum sp. Pbs-1 TaxID=3238748 RepID=A0AB33KTR5_9FLAO